MIANCVQCGDLSPLQPMSVKDLIWVDVAQRMKLEQEVELESAKRKAQLADLETMYLMLDDLRAVALDNNYTLRLLAVKGAKRCKVTPLDINRLPSSVHLAEEEERKKCAKMTPEELVLYRFNKGEKIN